MNQERGSLWKRMKTKRTAPIAAVCVFGLISGVGVYSKRSEVVGKPDVSNQSIRIDPIINQGDRESKKVALTFGAAMTPSMQQRLTGGDVKSWYNEELINVLEELNVPATLFLTGMWAETYPNETKKLSSNTLFEIGNHSYDHSAFTPDCYGLPSISDAQNTKNIKDAQQSIATHTGKTPDLFRFPGLCHDPKDVNAVYKEGLVVVDGDVTADDGFNTNTKNIVDKVVNNVQGGSIVVAHMHGGPNAPKTDEAMNQIIPALRGKGYELVKVSELMEK